MYSSLPYAMPQVILKIPYASGQCTYYSIIVYAMVSFEWTGAKFFRLFQQPFFIMYFTSYDIFWLFHQPFSSFLKRSSSRYIYAKFSSNACDPKYNSYNLLHFDSYHHKTNNSNWTLTLEQEDDPIKDDVSSKKKRESEYEHEVQEEDSNDVDVGGNGSRKKKTESEYEDDPVKDFRKFRKENYHIGTFHGNSSGCGMFREQISKPWVEGQEKSWPMWLKEMQEMSMSLCNFLQPLGAPLLLQFWAKEPTLKRSWF